VASRGRARLRSRTASGEVSNEAERHAGAHADLIVSKGVQLCGQALRAA